MPRYFGALTLALLVGMVLTRVWMLKRRGVQAMEFGKLDKSDFLIPPFALFYFYLVFAAAFGLPSVSTERLFESGALTWVGALFCVAGLSLELWSLISFGQSFRVGIDAEHPDRLITTGAFARTRNPVYVAFAIVLVGQFLIYPNWMLLVYLAAGVWLFHRQVLREEAYLERHYAAIWNGRRAELFSMTTVMVGMGFVMRLVTPSIVGAPPNPRTAAFWGVGALGLTVGFTFTYPMDWWLVKIGWEHGMASRRAIDRVQDRCLTRSALAHRPADPRLRRCVCLRVKRIRVRADRAKGLHGRPADIRLRSGSDICGGTISAITRMPNAFRTYGSPSFANLPCLPGATDAESIGCHWKRLRLPPGKEITSRRLAG